MKISTKKSIAWFFALGGFGGVALFVAFVLVLGFPHGREWITWAWPAGSISACLVASLRLRGYYRTQPFDWRGFWQIGTVELLFAAFYVGLLLSLFQAAWPNAMEAGIPLSMILASLTAWGMLLGARKGLSKPHTRIVFGVGWVYWWLGALGCGALIAFSLIFCYFNINGCARFLAHVLGLADESRQKFNTLLFVFRPALIFFPTGVLLTYLATRGLPKEVESPLEPASPEAP